jgi:hyperosmotically inducible protein
VRAKRWKKGESDFRMRDAFCANSMKHSKSVLTILFCTAAVLGYGQTPPAGTKPDNTKVNQRDRNAGEVTADQQKVNATDQELTRNIRRSIMADKSLSTYAHNIKIISQNGSVTLKGPVRSDDEKKSVVAKAVAVAGSADKVTDQVSVKR